MRKDYSLKFQGISIDRHGRWLEVKYVDFPRGGSESYEKYILHRLLDEQEEVRVEVEFHNCPEEYLYRLQRGERYPLTPDALPPSFKNDVSTWLDDQLSRESIIKQPILHDVLRTFKERLESL